MIGWSGFKEGNKEAWRRDAFDSKKFIGNRFFLFFFSQAQGEESAESHFIGNGCGNERKWDEIEMRPGGERTVELGEIRKSVEKKGRERSRNQRLFKTFCPVHRRKLAVAINKGAEFKLGVMRELERNGFFFCLLTLSLSFCSNHLFFSLNLLFVQINSSLRRLQNENALKNSILSRSFFWNFEEYRL